MRQTDGWKRVCADGKKGGDVQDANIRQIISEALDIAEEMNPQDTDGLWLEDLTVQVGPHIREWDIDRCYLWPNGRSGNTTTQIARSRTWGIDAVATRSGDGEYVAIQCKSRQLNTNGQGDPIRKTEIDKFANTSSGSFWAERWVVTNGDNALQRQHSASCFSRPEANQAGQSHQRAPARTSRNCRDR